MKETVPAFKGIKSAGKEQRDTQSKETETWEGPTNGAMSARKEQKPGSWTPEERVKTVDWERGQPDGNCCPPAV